jgi:hypothetical protein
MSVKGRQRIEGNYSFVSAVAFWIYVLIRWHWDMFWLGFGQLKLQE